MIRRLFGIAFLMGLWLQIAVADTQGAKAQAAKPEAKGQSKEDPLGRFRWLTASGEVRGLVFETRKLESLRVGNEVQEGTEIESEVTRPSTDSMRTTRRVFSRSVNGERQLVQVVVEDVRTTPGNGFSATRTVSQRDVNGNMRTAERETQETVPAGAGTFRTQATLMFPSSGDNLTTAAQIIQTETKKADGSVEIERNRMLPGGGGGWTTAERQTSSTRETNDGSLTQEEVYRQDANGKLSLRQREVAREWVDPQGRTSQDRETYTSSLAGSLELSARSSIVRTTYADGTTETAQTLLQRSPAAPSEGLKLVQKIQETVRATDSKTTERETDVQAPDSNGNLQTIAIRKTVEKK